MKNQIFDTERVRKLLKRIEWFGEAHTCPDCQQPENLGHSEQCDLVAVLREILRFQFQTF